MPVPALSKTSETRAALSVGRGGRRRRLSERLGPIGLALLLCATAGTSAAEEDEEPAPRSIVVAPRAETRIGAQEIVIEHIGGRVVVFMQRYVDGLPTPGAAIEVAIDPVRESLKEIAPGIYSSGPWPLSAGQNDVEIAFTVGGEKGTASLPLVVESGEDEDAANLPPAPVVAAVPGFILAALAVLIYAGVTGLLMRRSRRA